MEFPLNTHRLDPYKDFMFLVKWGDAGANSQPIAGVSKIGPLKRTTQVVQHRHGGSPSTSHKSPGRSEFEAISLEQGVTHDPEFEKWANLVWNRRGSPQQQVSLRNFRKDIQIEVYNEAGQLAYRYFVYRCWVSEYQAQAELNANSNAVLIRSMKIENEGWERDDAVKEPQEL
jgi:phage tail-like protein